MPTWHEDCIVDCDADPGDHVAAVDWAVTIQPRLDNLYETFRLLEGNRMPPHLVSSVLTIACAYNNWQLMRSFGGQVPTVRRQVPVSADPGDADVRRLPDVVYPPDWLTGLTSKTAIEWGMTANIPLALQHDIHPQT
jgi:hypothetical protein